jgi:hypothetical protein
LRPGFRGFRTMLDLIMFVLAVGLLALTIGYAYGCERL